MLTQACGVHLVGSINLPTTNDVFEQIPSLLPNCLRRIPDGETGTRHYFTRWQFQNFAAVPEVVLKRDSNGSIILRPSGLSPSQRSAALEKLQDLQTGYDHYALESYELFKMKKSEGVIPKNVRFQVSLPGIINVVVGIAPDLQADIEPLYEDALVRTLANIQNNIPHSDLAIQIDAALEFALLEGAGPWTSWFSPIFEGIIARLSRFANRVAADVELGFHLCYGDVGHRHFVEPKDMGLMVEVANALRKEVKRPIQWVHMPVPKGRTDRKYYEPLNGFEGEGTELYLGLVHVGDENGTRERINMAGRVLGERQFGIATECGLGRTPTADFEGIMQILKEVGSPVEK